LYFGRLLIPLFKPKNLIDSQFTFNYCFVF
jgi:hypothetical protein